MQRRRNPQATRQRLLQAAFREFHRQGFQTASLEGILAAAGVTKGALYHHFPSKLALGYAVVEEILRDWILERWLRPVAAARDPLAALVELARWGERHATPGGLALGSPLQNLAQEMSTLDDGFRRRLAAVYAAWRQGLAQTLAAAQQRGLIRPGVDPTAAAALVVSAWEGSIGLAKCERSAEVLADCRRGLEAYLRSLSV